MRVCVSSSSEPEDISITSLSGRAFGRFGLSFVPFASFGRAAREVVDLDGEALTLLLANRGRPPRENASAIVLCCPLDERSTGMPGTSGSVYDEMVETRCNVIAG